MRLVFSVLLLTVLCVGTGLHSAQAATQPSGIAKQIVQLWLDSEGHRSNIENEAFEVSGMGVGKHGDYYYFTQLFVGKD